MPWQARCALLCGACHWPALAAQPPPPLVLRTHRCALRPNGSYAWLASRAALLGNHNPHATSSSKHRYHVCTLHSSAPDPCPAPSLPPPRGEGFCVFNDIALAASMALRAFQLDSILVLDLDVHQGNGTSAIFEGEPRVVTFDMHGEHD